MILCFAFVKKFWFYNLNLATVISFRIAIFSFYKAPLMEMKCKIICLVEMCIYFEQLMENMKRSNLSAAVQTISQHRNILQLPYCTGIIAVSKFLLCASEMHAFRLCFIKFGLPYICKPRAVVRNYLWGKMCNCPKKNG